ncbi:hypothetical protein ANN_01680 [Periplaneta americana]|uniref:Histone-lysine N-methyltransferase SETMAR n=1 Tax=Periplaneta americana TaxID=6978 RepID=A0ABQ8TX83_PERAM|nr:hypothetical protein ANN_01680 [Periplaneta americana]
MSPGSSTESYPAFAGIGLRENPGKNLNQVTCPDRESIPGHLVSRPDVLTVTPQILEQVPILGNVPPQKLPRRHSGNALNGRQFELEMPAGSIPGRSMAFLQAQYIYWENTGVETRRFTTAEKGEGPTIIGQGDAECFLGYPRCDADRLCSEEANHHRSILPKSPDEVTGGYQDEASQKLSKGVLLLHDNAPAYSAQDTHAASLDYQILPHSRYSPDMTPSDFFLFPRMKKSLRGRHFQNDNEVIFEVERFLNSQNADFYNQGLHQVIHRWEKCVALKGEYVEKD